MLQEKKAKQVNGAEAEKWRQEIARMEEALRQNAAEQQLYTTEKWNRLSATEKALHEKAFTTNHRDPHFHELDELVYMDGQTERRLKMPKGDILHQFREDVNKGQLPTVSWIIAPENFSDHPSAAWYGAWYISEVMDILTKNPEVWKKTIFVLTYDENDGYFDHVPPFVAPNPQDPESGKTSAGIDTSVEFVANEQQQSKTGRDARVSPVGLGYRVPMVIASPWSRGGWVNSQVFDHTSSLQFLEHFLAHKTSKKIKEENISAWRRVVSGDLRSAFRPWNGEKFATPDSLDRNKFLEGIHKAQFRKLPDNYYKLDASQLTAANENPRSLAVMPRQESGIRPANALPYELWAAGILDKTRKKFNLMLAAGNSWFGDRAAGSPFQVYSYGDYKGRKNVNRHYAVKAGDHVTDEWSLVDFPEGRYNVHVYGPNGFYVAYSGSAADLLFDVTSGKTGKPGKPGNSIVLHFQNRERKALDIEIVHNAYGYPKSAVHLASADKPGAAATVELDLSKSHRWYDFTIRVKGNDVVKRFAGRIENGADGMTDPLMGGVAG
ncbi:MAG: alkaline phosphatase family protein [Flavihumibacter sp.]